jgi:hypothetical protein
LVDPWYAVALASPPPKAVDDAGAAARAARRAHAATFTWERCAAATLDAYRLAVGR